MRLRKVIVIVGVLWCLPRASIADWGSYPLRPNIKLYEPNQRAIIAWNGLEEILLLSADIRASGKTQVLKVIPFPSEPAVKEGDIASFEKAITIINQEGVVSEWGGGAGSGGFGGFSTPEPAGKVTFHDKIGGHDISVATVKESAGFTAWVKEYLGKQGVPNAPLSDEFIKIVKAYLKSGFKWFAFDIIEVTEDPKTVKPLQYRFKTDHLFYPLRISSLEEGSTQIDLIIITRRTLRAFTGIPKNRIKLVHQPFAISIDKLKTISEDMAELFTDEENVVLRIWQCMGKLSGFDRDIVVWD